MNGRLLVWLLPTAVLAWHGAAAAADQGGLIGVLPRTPGGTDYQAYYDPKADLTWLANANANGVMTWKAAMKWAASLKVNGVGGWRLPLTAQPDPSCTTQAGENSRGFRCTGSELGNLFYNVLGNKAYLDLCAAPGRCPKVHKTLEHSGPFNHLVSDYYWSASEYDDDPESAWYFDLRYGDQREVNKFYGMYAVAVHPGNVGHAAVPGMAVSAAGINKQGTD